MDDPKEKITQSFDKDELSRNLANNLTKKVSKMISADFYT